MQTAPGTPHPFDALDTDDSLVRWSGLTRAANTALAERRLDTALALHAHALGLAERLLDGSLLAERPDDCLAAFVVSHHNLADVHRARGRPGEAVSHLCAPHRRLVALIDDPATEPAVRDAGWRHLRETRAELLRGQQGPRADPALAAALHLEPAAGRSPVH